jgi:glyoxylase-like metal-dependent hydrolase (beta-lactamase superfamily II)
MAGDAAEVAAAHAAGESLAALAERLDLVLRTDRLVPLSRWVTPPFDTPRRYDTRFFVAALEDPAGVDIHPTEVLAHEWITPAAALAAGADGRIALWTPTSTTLAQLAGAGDLADVRRYLAPRAAPAPPGIIAERAGVVSVRLHGAGGIPGLSVVAHVVGRKRLVVVDPGDPGEAAIDAFLAIAADLGASIVAVLLTAPEPDHAAGASALADRVGVPVMASAACARAAAALLGGPAEGLLDGDTVTLGDMPLVVLATPGTHPGHLAFAVPSTDVVLVGDLWGPGPSRGIPGRTDTGALERSRAKVRDLAAARQLPAHR